MKQMENLNYGIVGNCKSAALISKDGALEWLCLPKFDASSVFAKLLDRQRGGSFELDVKDLIDTKQYYLPKTNILCTQYTTKDGSFELLDFMPRYKTETSEYYCPPDIIRYFRPISGAPKFSIVYNPQLEYAKYETEHVVQDEYIKSFTIQGEYDSLYHYSSFNLYDIIKSNTITLTSDQFCLISYNQKLLQQNIDRAYLKLQRTKVYWLNWSEKTTSFMLYNEQVTRSALVLKLLSYQKSGAVLAALTTSLPETIGEVRNWDYRFCWIRDASMVVKIMNAIGHHNVAHRYLRFIIDVMPDKDEKMQIMYGINGEKKLTEYTLDHLAGYENSKPVRIGNAAYEQKQNDIYGILLDVIYQNFKLFNTSLEFSEDLWTIVRNVVTVVEKNWTEPDRGIWEIRGEARHFTFSKILCWVAIDRAVRIAKLLKQDQYIYPWTVLCDTIKKDILENAWSEEKKAFTQAYHTEHLDASVLLMESYGFLPTHDSRYRSTVLAVQAELEHNNLMYRYKNNDDFGLPKSSFTICTFWLINSLYKIGLKEEARKKFDQLLGYSNHLGLFSEDLDFETKRMLGNFPQAYSHLALIETAMNISDQEVTDDDKIMEFIH